MNLVRFNYIRTNHKVTYFYTSPCVITQITYKKSPDFCGTQKIFITRDNSLLIRVSGGLSCLEDDILRNKDIL